MPWGRLDDSLYDHPKLDTLGRYRLQCVGLNTLAQSWCNRWLTDGEIPVDRIARLGGTTALADLLVDAGLWERTDGGYVIHDFLDYNDSRDEVLAQRAAARDRMREKRRSRPRGGGSSGGSSRDVPPNVTGSSDDVQPPRARVSRPDPSTPGPSSEGSAGKPRPQSERQKIVAWLGSNGYGVPSGYMTKPFAEMCRLGSDVVIGHFEAGRAAGCVLANDLAKFAERALSVAAAPRNGSAPATKGRIPSAEEARNAFVRE